MKNENGPDLSLSLCFFLSVCISLSNDRMAGGWEKRMDQRSLSLSLCFICLSLSLCISLSIEGMVGWWEVKMDQISFSLFSLSLSLFLSLSVSPSLMIGWLVGEKWRWTWDRYFALAARNPDNWHLHPRIVEKRDENLLSILFLNLSFNLYFFTLLCVRVIFPF